MQIILSSSVQTEIGWAFFPRLCPLSLGLEQVSSPSKTPPPLLPLTKPSFVFQGNSGERKGGGNDIFDFPHNPDFGKKKDFLWAAAMTLIFYADKIFPSSKKKKLWEKIHFNYTYSNFSVKKKKKFSSLLFFHRAVFFLPAQELQARASQARSALRRLAGRRTAGPSGPWKPRPLQACWLVRFPGAVTLRKRTLIGRARAEFSIYGQIALPEPRLGQRSTE